MEKISVIIPTYNEEKNIKRTVESVASYFEKGGSEYEIIVSDDGSTDQTVKILKTLQTANKLARIVENKHFGKARAIAGAIPRAEGKYSLLMDADGAASISQIERLLQTIAETGCDLAIGSREGMKAKRVGEPFYRHFIGRGFNFMVKIITGLRFEDTQCGFKLIKSDVLKKLSQKSEIMKRETPNLMGPMVTAFDVEILILANIFGYKISEVPIEWHYVATKGVNPLRDSFRMLLDLLKIRWNLYSKRY